MADASGLRGSGVDASEAIQALRIQFLNRLPGRMDDIQRMWLELSSRGWSQAQAETLHRAVHSLTGTSGTFGLRVFSEAARQFEKLLHAALERGKTPRETDWLALKLAHEHLVSAPRDVQLAAPAEPVQTPAEAGQGVYSGVVGMATDRWRVLLVDDDEAVLAVHGAVLRQAGMEVLSLSRSSEAIEAVRRFEPDVVLLDVYMPEASGPQIAAALRDMEDWLHLAILFVSSETDLTQQLLALDLGGDDFLIKPVQPAHLVAAVNARARRARHNLGVQRRLQTTLYEREREHLALDHHAIVSIADRRGRITYVNDLFCEVSGYSREELLGGTYQFLRSDDLPTGFARAIWDRISRGQVWQGEIRSKRKDGSQRWAKTTVTPFVEDDGTVYQYVAIQTDITPAKEAAATLRRQHDMQRTITVAAARLMAAPAEGTNEAIEASLRDSGQLLGAGRADLVGVAPGGETMSSLYTWSVESSDLQSEQVLNEEVDGTPWMREQFYNLGMVVIPDVAALPCAAADDRQMLQGKKVGALLVIPLHVNGQVVGFICYSSHQARPDWTVSHIELLKVLSDVVGSAIARKKGEAALRASEARLAFLVSSSPVTIFTNDCQPPFATTYVSPNVRQLVGHEPEEFLNDPEFWSEQVHLEDRALVFQQLPDLFRSDVHQHEYRMRTKDGQYRWIHAELRLVRDSHGQGQEIIGYWMDITERKHIEQELFEFNHELERRVADQTQSVIESERMARATLDALSARVVILDHHGVILAANRTWAEFRHEQVGFEQVSEGQNYLEMCDRQCDTLNPAGKPIGKGIRRLMSGEVDEFFHEYMVEGRGDTRWFVCRVESIPGDGSARVVVSHEDVTQMKQIERQQMRSQRLESLGTLAGGVAHDLNNALAPILMGMEVLKEDYPGEASVLNLIQASARRGADMVRQLLTFAKGADGERAVLDVVRLVHEIENLMKGSFPKDIQLVVNCDPLLPGVLGDATQLHQVLLNLCVNARDALPQGGSLSLCADWVDVDEAAARLAPEARAGRYVRLKISDSGTGIPPDILDRIFDPFFSTKGLDKGTGLGLSTVMGIVRGHKGFMQVHSKLGAGSTFSIHLPAHEMAQVAPVELPLKVEFVGAGEQILFVDDESAVRDIGQAVLTRLKLDPVMARDGADGLVKATHHQLSLRAVITDMHMPHMDGLAFARNLRLSLPEIPIIVCSGRLDEAAAAEFQSLGRTVRLDKPFTEMQLADALRMALVTG